ncbi:SPFH domain-containing protein [Butyrivibrio sp. YAB3001]|uniref:SPFH domain-containing protein n=1 Tax=Butyrivibrio sp. YAB3001 TaxID=1520812 RepID=UPI0008F6567B|nr:SPFH domain-containing protein [Butyrivibrio sp. YAB3001]SFC19929.1 Membrane protease subunit, stomatin/prohibitin family, contains C-terminal Zn-ribbon domain [Butyrivibrio sp. YAB3001]
MGLLQAALVAGGSVLSDQWRDYFYCPALSSDVLLTKGVKKAGKGNENIISNGSIIAVNEGQCMILVDQGQITEICAEAGEFVYDVSTEPSIFYGNLGENIVASFKEFAKRVGFGGQAAKDQRVYFINTKEILGNKYGTVNPVPFRVVDNNIGLDMDVSLKCHGEYSYRVVDPILFYKNICGNIEGEFKRERIESQLKSELLTALQPAFAKISEMGIRYSSLPGHTTEIADALNEVLSKKWNDFYGIKISSFGVSSVTASEEDEKTIKELQRAGALRNPNMAAATIASAQAQAMQDAAKNTATGPMMAFAGMNMAQQAGGMNASNLFQMGAQQQAQATPMQAPTAAGWTCSCGTANNGNFCTNCGQPRPAANWTCSCGAVNSGNFCTNCGSPRQNA